MHFFLRICFIVGAAFFPMSLWASVVLWHVLPNTIDDVNLEYMELYNPDCTQQSLSGYSIADASGKKYIFTSDATIESHSGYILGRPLSKIILNNTDEMLYLRDASGSLIDTWFYPTSEKGIILTRTGITDTVCTISDIQSNSGTTTVSGEISPTVSGESTVSGEGDMTGTGTPPIPIFSGKLLVNTLGYLDTNQDGYIDTLFLEYPDMLTGSVNTGDIFLYSNTGGLYPDRVNTFSGYILSGSIQDTRLYLSIVPATNQKTLLKINNTTTSELRLKSLGDLGVRSVIGQELESFFLTTSFNSYKNIVHPTVLVQPQNTSTTTVMTGENLNNTSSSGAAAETGVIFPEIVLTFQQYTNTTLSGDVLTCMSSPCRANFTLEPIFTGAILAKNYQCHIEFAGMIYETCNPPQLYPSESGDIRITLIHRESGLQREHNFHIQMPSDLPPHPKGIPQKLDTNPPTLIVEFDGKMHDYYEQINDYEFNCYTLTCSVNLTAEHSYDTEGKVRFLWIFGQGDIRTTRDPGTHKYGIGDHEIILRVFDDADNMAEVRYRVHVLGPREKEQKALKKSPKKEKISNASHKTQKKKKLIRKHWKKLNFFDPPTIELQKSKFTLHGGVYECQTKTKTCSINLKLTNTEKGLIYTWKYDDGEVVVSKNPRAKSLGVGVHVITVSASYSGDTDPIWSKNLEVKVIKIEKVKKKKKSKAPKKSKQKKSSLKIIPIASASDGLIQLEPTPISPAVGGLLGGMVIFALWYRRRKLNTVVEQDQ